MKAITIELKINKEHYEPSLKTCGNKENLKSFLSDFLNEKIEEVKKL